MSLYPDTNYAVSVCHKVADEIRQHLTVLGYQSVNCHGCKLREECLGHMRLERLKSGVCHYRQGA